MLRDRATLSPRLIYCREHCAEEEDEESFAVTHFAGSPSERE